MSSNWLCVTVDCVLQLVVCYSWLCVSVGCVLQLVVCYVVCYNWFCVTVGCVLCVTTSWLCVTSTVVVGKRGEETVFLLLFV